MSEKYAFIEAENATVAGETACAPTVTQMCSWLGYPGPGSTNGELVRTALLQKEE